MIKLKYLGMIAETLQKEEEVINQNFGNLTELESYLKGQYPKLNNLTFKYAINKQIATTTDKLNNNDEVALLPPFAGG